jgi:hypothetical protein
MRRSASLRMMTRHHHHRRKPKKFPTGESRIVQPVGVNPLVRAKASLTSLPPETIQEIFKYTNHISGACLALSCKHLFNNGEKFQVSCPKINRRYSCDRDRVQFMKLFQTWMPKDYRFCWICRKYKAINGGTLILYEQEEVPKKKKTTTPLIRCKFYKTKEERKNEDWTFVSIGACISEKKIETRTYCPKCTANCHDISLM